MIRMEEVCAQASSPFISSLEIFESRLHSLLHKSMTQLFCKGQQRSSFGDGGIICAIYYIFTTFLSASRTTYCDSAWGLGLAEVN